MRGSGRDSPARRRRARSRGGTSTIVDRIEAAGLCRRRPNPDDRRSSLIGLTPAGRARLADASARFDDELARWVAVLPPATLDRFHSALRRLRAAARAHEQPDDHGGRPWLS